MTENEAIKVINDKYETFFALSTTNVFDIAMATAIKTLEEIQQYRAIGTVEDIQKVLSFLGDENKRSIIDDLKLLNEYKATGLTPELIEAMQGHNIAMINDLAEYQEIGTVEELKEIRAKAIDEFAEALNKKISEFVLEHKDNLDFASGISVAWNMVDEIAEQMKAGGKNES